MRASIVACLVIATCCLIGCGGSTSGPPPVSTMKSPNIPELPDYTGASALFYQVGSPEGWTNKFEKKLNTSASLAEVKAFYQKAITDYGWQVVGVEEKPNKVEWKLAKVACEAKIEIESKTFGGVQIKLERKDR